jgi:RND family efflux transporter MFP subunit
VKSILRSGLFGVLIGLGAIGCGSHSAPMGQGSKGPPEVYVSTPVTRDILDYEEFPGQLEASQTIQIRARVTGYLLRFNFKEGGTVNKGDVLFEIDPQLYEAELALAEGNVLEAKGEFEKAGADWRRVQRLHVPSEVSAEDVNKFRGAYIMADGKQKAAKANLKKAQVNMGYTKVVAPIGGRVSKTAIHAGNLVRADDTILTSIGASNPIKASFDIDERTLARVLRLMDEGVIPKDPTGIPVDMWLADQTERDKPIKGAIDFYDAYVDTATGTLRVRGVFDNGKDLLVPGMFVRVRLYIGKPQPSVLVAEKALVTDQGQKFIYVLKNEDTSMQEGEVEYRPVDVGRLREGLRVIKNAAVKPTEKVVVSGLQRIQRGSKVKCKEVEMPVSASTEVALDTSKSKPASVAKTPETATVSDASQKRRKAPDASAKRR